MTVEQYWQQIVLACFLDEDDPIGRWKLVFDQIYSIQSILNEMPIEKVHVSAKGTDLWVGLGEKRKWLGGSGRNIPPRSSPLRLAPGGRYYLLISLFIVTAT